MTEIASETKIVHDKNMGIDRKVIAGQPIPPDLVDAYNGKKTSGEKKAPATGEKKAPAAGEKPAAE